MLTKPKKHPIKDVIEGGIEYEAIQASQISLGSMSIATVNAPLTNVDSVTKTRQCLNCGQQHMPRSYPAYHSKCHSCGNKGHWQQFCRKSRKPGPDNKQKYKSNRSKSRYNKGNTEMKSKVRDQHEVCVQNTQYDCQMFYSIKISDLSVQSLHQKDVKPCI